MLTVAAGCPKWQTANGKWRDLIHMGNRHASCHLQSGYTIDDAMLVRMLSQAMDFHRCVQYCASQCIQTYLLYSLFLLAEADHLRRASTTMAEC